jgi:predicted RecB family nuclease
MATKITREVLVGFLNCKTKAHLKLVGEQGNKSDYERLIAASREEVRQEAISKILSRQPDLEVARNIRMTATALRAGSSFVVDAMFEDDWLSIAFDGLKRVDGPSKLGDFHYIPMLFGERRPVRKEERLLLELYGLCLSKLQGLNAESGIIWHGNDCRPTKVRLNPDSSNAKRIFEEIRQLESSTSPPRLILIDHCQTCEFRQRCMDQAVQDDNISLLRGMKEKEAKRYARKGILTVTQLAHTFRPVRRGKRTPPRSYKHHHALQALAIRDKRVYVYGTPVLRSSPVHIYLDVEGLPDDKFEYLVGMIVVEGGSEQRYSFWADDTSQQKVIFERFLAAVARYDDFLVFCYGGYEKAFLTRMRKHTKKKNEVDRVLKSLVNTLSLVYTHFYFPTYSNGLKDVGECLGCSWTDTGASGVQSIAWRMRWQATKESHWKDKLTAYNLDDCAALRKVTEFIYTAMAAVDPAVDSGPIVEGGPTIALVQEIDRLGRDRRRGRIPFFHSDFEHIINCGHFDYQRRRVYVRTSKVLRNIRKKPRWNENKKLKVNRRIEITSNRCPECGGTEIIRWSTGKKLIGGPRVKRVLDLVFTSGGIRRRVIECHSPVHECANCGKSFMPERYTRLAAHTHSLMSWSIFELVGHRISLRSLRDMIREFFGFSVSASQVNLFKTLMASYYRTTYTDLLKRILSSALVHADETAIKLQKSKGYVWVLTNLEEVVFMFRPTREGAFLQKLLKNFHGVLISDFYSAYDSINCPQQKCLIHLMRDMNEDLLNHPFDEELQSITCPFGQLLREIVATIDQHGLKQRRLRRHERAVAKYFQSLAAQKIRSEPATALRERLTRYKDKLFTFIKYDGVPWNNNNAEYAIKQFVYYREHTDGFMSEAGLRDYLVLLSIRQTCKFRGISFLKFLLSKERNIDAFGKGRRTKRLSTIDIYPKGFSLYSFSRSGQAVRGETKPPDQG